MGTLHAEHDDELIRLFVLPQINTKDFHEVTPDQLEEYLRECKDQKRNRSHKRSLYHQSALVAKVDMDTTDMEIERLLESGVRTLLVQTKCNKPQDIEKICLKINTYVNKFYLENIYRTPIGIAVELNGELLTTGRMRNDCKSFVDTGHILILTTNEDYRYCCFKEIIYVYNLWRYLDVVDIGDVIQLDEGRIVAKVIKCGGMRPLTVEITKPGNLSSYMNVKMPYFFEVKELSEKDILDIEAAMKFGVHYIVIPGIRGSSFVKAVRQHIAESIRIIGSMDIEYMETKFIDIADHLTGIDIVWIEDLFNPNSQKTLTSAIAQCNNLGKPIIGTVPIKTCGDFKRLENNERISEMDCLLIEKSPLRKKYPLIVKQLLPVTNNKIEVPMSKTLSCKDGIVNFVLRTIYSIPCQGIVVSNTCPNAALAFAIPQIYCPVVALVKNDQLARQFNFKRNLKSVVLKSTAAPTEYGIAFGRKHGIFNTGDFVISISESMDEHSQICINLRAYYLPPIV